MKVVWTPEAEQDRDAIWLTIAADNGFAAVHMDELFSDAAARLADHPKLGRPGKIAGTRELIPHESYRLVYEVDRETVWIPDSGSHVATVAAGATHVASVIRRCRQRVWRAT